ncbi:hypothetical protein [Priestia koreensis]|uniref:hypothetical protein n=1 Tax=Priestia koreensis TaxID=284581 RepID=UPI0026D6E9A2
MNSMIYPETVNQWSRVYYVKTSKKMKLLCIEYQEAMPIEMKLVYELLHTIHDTKLPEDFADEWFEEVKRNKL